MNITDDKPHWFAARTANCRELKARDVLVKYGIEHFIPTEKTIEVRSGRKKLVEKSLTGNLVFFRATKTVATSLVNYNGLQVHFIPDRCGGGSMLVVPDKQMDDFRRVFEYWQDGMLPASEFVPGDKVEVVAGDLAGVEGEVYENAEGTFVVVTLSGLLRARAKVPANCLRRL